MNAERLGLIARSIIKDLDESNVQANLSSLINALTTQIGEHNEANEKQISDSLKTLYEAIDGSKFSKFPRTWRSALEELEIHDLLGDQLRHRIENSFEKHTGIHVDVRDEIQEVNYQIGEFRQAFEKILEGFGQLKISEGVPKAGEAELSILMPRDAFDSELDRFADEIKDFVKGINLFSELATKTREAPKIKQLSTTDPFLVIALNPASLYLYLKVVEKLLDLRAKTYQLRILKVQAEEAEAGRDIEKSINKKINAKIIGGITEIKEWLFKEYEPEKDRITELKKEADMVLRPLADRIDGGYQIEGDIGTEEGEEGKEQDPKIAKQISEIKEIANRIRYLDTPSEPVLQLVKPAEKDDQSPDAEEDAEPEKTGD